MIELMKKCMTLMPYHGKLSDTVYDVLFSDSSIHKTLFQIACTTAHALEVTHVEAFSVLYHLLVTIYFGCFIP